MVTDRQMAYALLRIAFGINFAGHGFTRIHVGVAVFAANTAQRLANAPLPHGLVLALGYVIPFAEAALGLALIFGILTRLALICGSFFMMMLTAGTTANQQWDVASQQLLYLVVFFILLHFRSDNWLALDQLRYNRT
ncbi:DoxX family protein [Terriglobus sp. 2YAB30_2]